MKFETKIAKLGIKEEVESILRECELYNPQTDVCSIIELSKLRRMDIMEVIGNYLNHEERWSNEEETDWDYDMRFKTFLKAFQLEEKDVAEMFKLGIDESGYAMAYAITDDIVLVIDEK